ncbi:ChaN family lipoprotein [Ramlibacter ginsenosidimutans]|uniref:ChaN family lipoprotein n=1 Tax=Ramlibacter ginsenosidimutans TaxID=502333 RepID=A0A934TQX8_9BURK|nr:ChaN family lipoprotein [Ramlibacter ginsenosidimutans]MBK6005828.1 ChaN family lipoprotein [Ramlibacter ginsenosidimutans]
MRFRLALASALLLGGCAAGPLLDTAGVDALLLGEQHDAPAQPRLQQRWVETLAHKGTLAGVALEMADRGTSTAGLPAAATEDEVRTALHWNAEGWPWPRYAPAIMAAVRAGAPVFGANLPREAQQQAMQDSALDRLLPGPALKAQQQAVRRGHCDLLPETQITPMTRVQIARDRAMAETIAAAAVPGKTVVLVAGAGHVEADIGVPRHVPANLVVRSVALPHEETGKDYCAQLRQDLQGRSRS